MLRSRRLIRHTPSLVALLIVSSAPCLIGPAGLAAQTSAVTSQCTSAATAVGNDEAIQSLGFTITTADSLCAGTDDDVWIDVGPKAWKLQGGFTRNSTRTVTIVPSNIADGSGLSPSEVPLFVRDIKFVRLEKKGIGMTDLPPLTPELIAMRQSGFAQKIGGLTNAPDSLPEILVPGGLTPQRLLGDAGATLATAQLALGQAQSVIGGLQEATQQANAAVQSATQTYENLVHQVGQLEIQAAEAMTEVNSVQNRLADVAFKFALRQVCHNETVMVGTCILFPPACLHTIVVCHNEKVVTDAWNALNSTLPGLQQRAVSKAAELDAKTREVTTSASTRTALVVARESVLVQLKLAQLQIGVASDSVHAAQEAYDELKTFISRRIPSLEFPLPGQWVPSAVTLTINGRDRVSCQIRTRLKRGNSSWVGVWQNISPAELFAYGLRVNVNEESSGLDRYVSGLSTYFKVNDVSGWAAGPVKTANVVGILQHEPSSGADGFVSLDLKLETVKVGRSTLVLDNEHGIGHARFIRIEYRHRQRNGREDDRYNQWHVGDRISASGKVERDNDRATFYEIHPEKASEIKKTN